ncbi:fimbrial protein [Salmonella enterica subsp. enterica serovar Typhi]|nr:fimbrial protein [Salmonella enterica subsp. enterica serovar Typhi]CGP28184.1 fimbrial protein [Salmonella enterica subsp. enterica serovar Typhi]CHP44956.1 fimbrial protein [Salmonella enterica subsp. enterica serovar Typhi]CHS43577.1 fimbrial protein [Salmonella enterica subsp. enterica serovar Typhi]CRJ23299.1 fimbrial protein [Salmonella enterica subsp. enterica serovar Typhi]
MIRKGAALVGLVLMSPVIAQPVMVESGRVHLRGQLVNGGCAVATESQDLRVLMGQYRTNAFWQLRSRQRSIFVTVNLL